MKNLTINLIGRLLKSSLIKWWQRDPFNRSAVIAYNAIFSLPGLLVVVTTIAGYFFGQDAVTGRLHSQVEKAMGTDTADQIQTMVLFANQSKDSLVATVFGIAVILIGATGVFVHMQKSLNNIWEVEATITKAGIWPFLKSRIFSFGLIITIAFLLLVSLVLSSLLAALGSWVAHHWSHSLLVVFQLLNVVFSLIIITVLFAIMFKFLPDAKVKWYSVWVGAFFTALLFAFGETALGLYFGKANPASGYGAAASLILILLWTSYTSMIVFFGAEFTKAYSDYRYGVVPPTENAIKLKHPEDK